MARLINQGSGNARSASPNRPSIFSNFECDQLTSDERLYLHAARTGDMLLLRELLETPDLHLNYNCVDYMGRNSLHLAVDSENVEMVEFLTDKVAWECIEEALLHAISKGYLAIVRLMVDHPKYMSEEKHVKLTGKKDPFFRKEEKYQYPPDITPLILAAHQNDHEIVQLFLQRGYNIERPHAIQCQCSDCRYKQESDSLKRSRSRLNAYKALSSPAYMALSSPDPITTTFELRQEMMAVAQIEKEFKKDYISLVDQCMDFACQCMNLCRGTQEMDAIMGDDTAGGGRDPLARLRLAVQYEEKRFVAHANTQQHLTNLWYGTEMSFLQGLSWIWKLLIVLAIPPILPFACILYIINPNTKVGRIMRCPVSKFITHTLSHLIFLILLAVATFGLEEVIWSPSDNPDDGHKLNIEAERELHIEQTLKYRFRPARWPITHIQLLIIFFIVGNLCLECKQIYTSGAKEHFLHYYNYMDFTILALYSASYSLRFATLYRLHEADKIGNYTERAREALLEHNRAKFDNIVKESRTYQHNAEYYFMSASRFDWFPHDPEIIADVLFAVANLLSFARTTYVMPSHELLGPLQISLGRMFSDIARFLVLFILVLVAFMVGMTNLYRYYGTQINREKENLRASAESFKGLPDTVYTLFFSIFGLIALDKLKIIPPENHQNARHSTKVVDLVGLILFAMFQVAVTIVLVNMLIAMMSHSFEAIQCDNDVEWKYARTKLWLSFIDEGSTLPVPFNTIPTPKTFKYFFLSCKNVFTSDEEEDIVYDFSRRRENVLITGLDKAGLVFNPKTTYSDIIQRLMRRYLFQMDRVKKERLTAGESSGHSDIVALEDEEEVKSSGLAQTDEITNGQVMTDVTCQNHNILLTLPVVDMRFSNSSPEKRRLSDSQALRGDIQRKATLTRKRTIRKHTVAPSNDQMESIQRTQKLIEARLQDIQMQGRQVEVPVKSALERIREISMNNHTAMLKLLETMQAMHADLMLMSDAFRQYASISSSGSASGGKTHIKERTKVKQQAYQQRSHPTVGRLPTLKETHSSPVLSAKSAYDELAASTSIVSTAGKGSAKPKRGGLGTLKISLNRAGKKGGGGNHGSKV